jgi:hypothetical protein
MLKREVKPVTGRTEMVGPPGRIVVKDKDVGAFEKKGYVVIEETTLALHQYRSPNPPADEKADKKPDDKTDDSLESKTVKQLRKLAKGAEVSGEGKKADIIERIKAKQAADAAADAADTGADADAGDAGGDDDAGDSAGSDGADAGDGDAGDDAGTDDAGTSGGGDSE